MGFESIFKKIADASATGGGSNIRDGIYSFLIEKCSIQNGHTGVCFVAEFRVMESSFNGALDEQGKPVTPNPVGSTCSMVCNLTKHESAAGNVKAFLQGALGGVGYTPEMINDELISSVVSADNPLRGAKVVDETYRGVNKGRSNAANAGKPLTLNKWKSVSQTEEDIAAGRKYLDDNAARAEVAPATKPAMTLAAQPSAAAETPTEPAAELPKATATIKPGGLLGALKRPA
jgi:hypothetical protein